MILNDKQRDQLLSWVRCASVATPEDLHRAQLVNEPFNLFAGWIRCTPRWYALARPASFDPIRQAHPLAGGGGGRNRAKSARRLHWLDFLSPFTNYSSAHSLHVSLLLAILMQRLGLTLPERISLLSAALTMNIGMYEVQNQLITRRCRCRTTSAWKIDHYRSNPCASCRIALSATVPAARGAGAPRNWEDSGHP